MTMVKSKASSIMALAAAALVAVAAVGCSKAPRGVISESDMADLIVDLTKADAYLGLYPDKFPDDSSKQALKQSVFAMHHVTQADYDSSMVWYAHNLDVYDDVYDRVVKQLTSDQNDLNKQLEKGGGLAAASNGGDDGGNESNPAEQWQKRTYTQHGDTADLWAGQRAWLLTGVVPRGYVTFDIKPDGEYRSGDRYQLNFKLIDGGGRFAVVMGADYSDGSTSVVQRSSCEGGWTTFELQTDRDRIVRRVFGYVSYDLGARTSVAFVDSVSLLRTHFDQSKYSTLSVQRLLRRDQAVLSAPTAPKAPVRPLPAEKKPTPPTPATSGHYKPKPGVNKSSRSLHVEASVNAAHRGH